MKKQEAKDIAKLLIYASGASFDGEAFTECNLSEKDVQKVLDEIQDTCWKEIIRIKNKYGLEHIDTSSTQDIVEAILYE